MTAISIGEGVKLGFMTNKLKTRAVATITRSGEGASLTGDFTRDEIWAVYSAMVDRRMVAVLKKEAPRARLSILRSRRFVFKTAIKDAESIRDVRRVWITRINSKMGPKRRNSQRRSNLSEK
jgi:hypothetical protein